MDFCVILNTAPNIEEAKKIARYLVESKLAACVNIIPQITSVYSWKEEIIEDQEFLLLIKTRSSNFKAVKDAIIGLHSYELPEVIMLPIKKGLKDYLFWLEEETKATKEE